MSLIQCPSEIILKISALISPDAFELPDDIFANWVDNMRRTVPFYKKQTRDIYALSSTCRTFHRILPRHPDHVHFNKLGSGNWDKIMMMSNLRSLSAYELSATYCDFFLVPNIIEAGPEQDDKGLTSSHEKTVNLGIRTLYLSRGRLMDEGLIWFLYRLPNLKELYYSFEHDPYADFRCRSIRLYDRLLQHILHHNDALQKLVLTVRKTKESFRGLYPGDYQQHRQKLPNFKAFSNLTSLKIASCLLSGELGEEIEDNMHLRLPASLVELEIFIAAADLPFIAARLGAPGPNWLFNLLKKKKDNTPRLERIRITSEDPAWVGRNRSRLSLEATVWDDDFDPYEDNWEEAEGFDAWRLPTELIHAFEAAEVSFGLFVEPGISHRLLIPGGTWFDDHWDEKWKDDRGCVNVDE